MTIKMDARTRAKFAVVRLKLRTAGKFMGAKPRWPNFDISRRVRHGKTKIDKQSGAHNQRFVNRANDQYRSS